VSIADCSCAIKCRKWNFETCSKYERTKQIANELKEREDVIVKERNALVDNLKMQEARYDKMKAHAMSQLE